MAKFLYVLCIFLLHSEETLNTREDSFIPTGCLQAEEHCPSEHVKLFLYTSGDADPHQLDLLQVDTIRNAPLLPKRPIKVLIHGFTSDHNHVPNTNIRPAYLSTGEYNVVSVDYSRLAKPGCYVAAVRNIPTVSKCTAQIIEFLVQERHIPFKLFHIIGFSLGAQVAGQIANHITSGRISRITGLDPAMPLFFSFENPKIRLDAGDADFVDIIHTNSGWKGELLPGGDVDFYVNGGTIQIGCQGRGSHCHHERAPAYFAESITTKVGFWGRKCDSRLLEMVGFCNMTSEDQDFKALMGEFIDKRVRGVYFVSTNDKAPFARGLTKATEGGIPLRLFSTKP